MGNCYTVPPAQPSQEIVQTPAVTTSVRLVDTTYRTAKDTPLSAEQALAKLKEGNDRYAAARSERASKPADLRTALATDGQNPFAIVIGCADSRCPVETSFDAQPGDIFVLRNAGNACRGEGSIVASSEYAVGALNTKLLVVLGHTKCGAMVGATKVALSADSKKDPKSCSALERYLGDLAPAAEEAAGLFGNAAFSVDDIAAHAIRLNVHRTIQSLLESSAPLREKVSGGGVEIHGGVYNIETGKVEFLGQHPDQKKLLQG